MWTPDALASEARSWRGPAWRVVESQSKVSTMKLVDTLDEQQLLETVLERSKPPFPAACAGMHFLLKTPFRYYPYPTGSRFRRAEQSAGCFYASDTPETAIAEMAFYKFLFFLDADGMILPGNALEHTAYSVQVGSRLAIDLTTEPLDQDRLLWEDLTNYGPCQGLADSARDAGIGVIRYLSVRDPQKGMNVAVLDPTALVSRQPENQQTWHLFIGDRAVQAFREMPNDALEFKLDVWRQDPRIADALTKL